MFTNHALPQRPLLEKNTTNNALLHHLLCPRRNHRNRIGGKVVTSQKMDEIARFISERENCDITKQTSCGSSQWASFRRYETADEGKKFFVKLSRKDDSMFRGEKAGLEALREAGSPLMVVPKVFYAGGVPDGFRDGNSMIIMEHLNFGARGDQGAWRWPPRAGRPRPATARTPRQRRRCWTWTRLSWRPVHRAAGRARAG